MIRKYNYKTVLRLLPIIAFAFVACTENEADPFSGKDNYIAAFSLTQGNTVFDAAIAGDVITVTVPEGLSLNNAKATVKLSENASIYPDPAKITAWDDEALFAVTAYNGAKATYKYTVARSGVAREGTVVLETQADVDAFGQLGITFIDGNLTVGRAAGTDSITSLAPLAGLKEVAYSLTLNPTYAGTGLEGLENLERVGGTLQVGALKHLEILTLPALKIAGSVSVANTVIIIVELPALERVDKAFALNCPLYQLQLPNLKSTGDLTLTAASNANTSLAKISLPALEEAGHIVVSNLKSVAKIELPELKKSGNINLSSALTQLEFVYAPKLEEATGTITVSTAVTAMTELGFPELKRAAGVYIDSKILGVPEFPKLTHVDNLTLRTAPLNGITGFPALQTAGTVTLYNLASLTDVTVPASVQRIDVLTVTATGTNPVPAEINIRGKNIGALQVTANAVRAKIIGDDVFHGTLTINSASATSPYPVFPVLEGFHEVDSLVLSITSYMDTAHVKGVRKINRGFTLASGNGLKAFDMPDLESVGGNMTLGYFTGASFTPRNLNYPKLQSVGGNLDINTGYGNYSTEALLFPQLATVGGKLYIHGNTTSNKNTKLADLDGFAALRNVPSIEVKDNSALVSFAGLQRAFESLTPAGWIQPTGNGYNPSYEDLQNNKWTE